MNFPAKLESPETRLGWKREGEHGLSSFAVCRLLRPFQPSAVCRLFQSTDCYQNFFLFFWFCVFLVTCTPPLSRAGPMDHQSLRPLLARMHPQTLAPLQTRRVARAALRSECARLVDPRNRVTVNVATSLLRAGRPLSAEPWNHGRSLLDRSRANDCHLCHGHGMVTVRVPMCRPAMRPQSRILLQHRLQLRRGNPRQTRPSCLLKLHRGAVVLSDIPTGLVEPAHHVVPLCLRERRAVVTVPPEFPQPRSKRQSLVQALLQRPALLAAIPLPPIQIRPLLLCH